jgi:hypothetical protein
MSLNWATSTDQDQLDWPQEPSGILIMGKRQGTKKENKQLWGRVAMATALWYSAPYPKPYIIFVAFDVHGPQRVPDAAVIKSMLIETFGIPGDFLIMRQKTNCTLLEMRAVRVIAKNYNLATVFAVTHLYHAPRTQRYINEVIPGAAVIPVHPTILQEITFPAEADDLLPQIQKMISDSLPKGLDLMREQAIERLLSYAHTIDHRGRVERYLARILRPRSYQ